MIEINLLPEELRKKKKKKEQAVNKVALPKIQLHLENVPVVKIAVIVVSALVFLHAALIFSAGYGKKKVVVISAEYKGLLPKKSESDALKARAGALRNKVNAINELMANRFSWAKKLDALSDSVTPGIWLSQLEYSEAITEKPAQPVARGKKPVGPQTIITRNLILSGYASSRGEQGTALVGKFIKSLKENEDFFHDLNDIQLGSIRTDMVANQEVMNFRVTCLFKDRANR